MSEIKVYRITLDGIPHYFETAGEKDIFIEENKDRIPVGTSCDWLVLTQEEYYNRLAIAHTKRALSRLLTQIEELEPEDRDKYAPDYYTALEAVKTLLQEELKR